MKKFLAILALSLFSCEVFADEDLNSEADQGILRRFVKEDKAEAKPRFYNRLVADIAFDDNYQATSRSNEFKESQGKVRFYTGVGITKNISLNSYIKLEKLDTVRESQRRSASPNGGGDRAFENAGAFFEELNINYDSKNFGAVAGKFNLNFGTAWRFDRGIWMREIADNYRQREKLGFAGVARLGDLKKTGRYNFSFAAFTNDRKNLDNSVFSKRDSENKSQGAPGGERGLESYVASLDVNFDFGEKNNSVEKLSYHFSYINMAVNESASPVSATKIDNEKGYVLGMNYKYPFAQNFKSDMLLEFSELKNVDGNSDIYERYLTANAVSKFYRNWIFNLGYSQRQNIQHGANGFDQNLSEISFGYEFDKTSFFDRFLIQAGYKHQRNDFHTSLEKQNTYGILARYYKNF